MSFINEQSVSTFRQNLTSLSRRLRKESENTPQTWSTLLVLSTIDQVGGGISPGELAKRENFHTSNLATMLKTLEQNGLILRQKDPSDGRRVRLYLTERANKLLSENRYKRDKWLFNMIEKNLTHKEVEVLFMAGEIMAKLSSNK